MPTGIITNTLLDPDSDPISGITVEARLTRLPANKIDTGTAIVPPESTTTNGSGEWSLTLERSNNISNGAQWVIYERVPASMGGGRITLVDVTAGTHTLAEAALSEHTPPEDDEFYTRDQIDALLEDIEGGEGVSDHGALTGLADDDHTQYHNNTRGDVRYYTKAQVDSAIITDHGTLSGLGDDDHTQYHNNARGDARYPRKVEGVAAVTGGVLDLSDNDVSVWSALANPLLDTTQVNVGDPATIIHPSISIYLPNWPWENDPSSNWEDANSATISWAGLPPVATYPFPIVIRLVPFFHSGNWLFVGFPESLFRFDYVRDNDGATVDDLAPSASPTFTGTVTVPNDSFTLAKLQDIATARLLGRNTAGSGDIEELTAATAKTLLALVKGDVGLANVDNTSDANKPVSTATQTALNLKEDKPVYGYKSADGAAKNNDTTLATDAPLALALLANSTYDLDITLYNTGPTAADIAFRLTQPGSGWTIQGHAWGNQTSAGNAPGNYGFLAAITDFTTAISAGTGPASSSAIQIRAMVFTDASAGTLNLQWAQAVAAVGDTKVLKGSIAWARKVA